MVLEYIISGIFFCVFPVFVLFLCRKVKILGKIGPVLLLYILGVIFGNLGIFPDALPKVQDVLSTVMVPLAIPLMLFSCTFNIKRTGSSLKALLSASIAVMTCVVAGYFIFKDSIPDPERTGAMLTGVFTGGTINMAALKTMLGASDESYILLNSYDMLVCFFYLMFLLAFGIKLARKWLPFASEDVSDNADALKESGSMVVDSENPYSGLFTKAGLKDAGFLLGVTLVSIALAAAVASIFPKSAFMVVFILILTTLGIAASFVKKIHSKKYGYDIGMYFIYIFSFVVASMADVKSLDVAGGMSLLGYLTLVVFGSLAIHALLSRLLKVDADTMVISSVAFINSPPFVPMVSGAMKNRSALVTGLSIGIVGYAVGNYLGWLIYMVLCAI